MADIRYVILSDLHFGATNSMLTSLSEGPATAAGNSSGFAVDLATTSPMLHGLLDGLAALTRDQASPPTLVLAGDVVDLALSPDEVAATVFGTFARLAFGAERPLFAPVVHYLPGNHDHHLWETSRETQYVEYTSTLPADQALAAPWHTTPLLAEQERPVARSAWLTSLIRRQPGCADVEVHVSYPNLAFRSADGAKAVVVSHGHYTESIYTLMTRLKDTLYPDQRASGGLDIATLEEENFAWIDFFWSTLGRSGQVGDDVGLIYADLTSAPDLDGLVANVTASLLARGKGPSWLHPAERWALNAIFRREVNALARSERGTPDAILSVKGRAGLVAYLGGPLLGQLRTELGSVPEDLTFVYGHTHKPFVDQFTVPGYPGAVRVHNTGGWVVDTAAAAPVQAGVVVLVDTDLDVASLELYRQRPDGAASPAQVLPPPAGGPPSPLEARVATSIDAASEPWVSLAAAAAGLEAQRHRLQTALNAEHSTKTPRRRL